jgi:hypothetical protein
VTNNHYLGKAAVNALQLKNMITRKRVKVPEPLKRSYWELDEIAENQGTGDREQGTEKALKDGTFNS